MEGGIKPTSPSERRRFEVGGGGQSVGRPQQLQALCARLLRLDPCGRLAVR